MDNPKVSVRRTKKYGKAVYATKPICKGELIAVFDGPVFDNDFEPWTDDVYNHAIQFGKALWRDSQGIARLINHSCDPNCGIKNLFSIVAMKPIKAGEQVTWDYEMTEKNPHWKMKCHCGSAICRKSIGNYKNLPTATRKKYEGYISDWLTQTPTPHRKFISIISMIPEGRVATYGQIASLAGYSGHARQVVWALHSHSNKYKLPWYRVINSKGKIAFKTDTQLAKQRFLLRQEGIECDFHGEIDLAQYHWKPKLSTVNKSL